jgi:hypothetical protein
MFGLLITLYAVLTNHVISVNLTDAQMKMRKFFWAILTDRLFIGLYFIHRNTPQSAMPSRSSDG